MQFCIPSEGKVYSCGNEDNGGEIKGKHAGKCRKRKRIDSRAGILDVTNSPRNCSLGKH
jgi:hypothetical protein